MATAEEIAAARETVQASMKDISRDTFRICADSVETMAEAVESGVVPDTPVALRLLVGMFRSCAEKV
jgi:hypothetical protein